MPALQGLRDGRNLAVRKPRESRRVHCRPGHEPFVTERGDTRATANACAPSAAQTPRPHTGAAGRMQSAAPHKLVGVAGRTQEALYAEIDLELSWSEVAL